MSKIYNISAGFLQSYVTLQSKHGKISLEEIFKGLSFEMGGDGKTITKDQLSNYLKKARNGEVSITKEKMKALTYIQKNWDKISGGEDSISFENLKDCVAVLALTMAGGFDEIEIPDKDNSTVGKINEFLKKKNELKEDSEITIDMLNEYLKSLLEDEKNTEIDDEIAIVTNMIATFEPTSTVEAQV